MPKLGQLIVLRQAEPIHRVIGALDSSSDMLTDRRIPTFDIEHPVASAHYACTRLNVWRGSGPLWAARRQYPAYAGDQIEVLG